MFLSARTEGSVVGECVGESRILFTLNTLDSSVSRWRCFWRAWGVDVAWNPILLTLPVGISFYTFQSFGYAIDVFHRRVKPERDVVAFLSYVAFFHNLWRAPLNERPVCFRSLKALDELTRRVFMTVSR